MRARDGLVHVQRDDPPQHGRDASHHLDDLWGTVEAASPGRWAGSGVPRTRVSLTWQAGRGGAKSSGQRSDTPSSLRTTFPETADMHPRPEVAGKEGTPTTKVGGQGKVDPHVRRRLEGVAQLRRPRGQTQMKSSRCSQTDSEEGAGKQQPETRILWQNHPADGCSVLTGKQLKERL